MSIAGVATVLCHRLKQPVVLGYILAGVIIGPHTPPFVLVTTDTENALEWINLGALGVVNKLNMAPELVTAVRSAAAGFSYLSSYARRSY